MNEKARESLKCYERGVKRLIESNEIAKEDKPIYTDDFAKHFATISQTLDLADDLEKENQQIVKGYQDLGNVACKLKKANKKLKAKNKSLEEIMKLIVSGGVIMQVALSPYIQSAYDYNREVERRFHGYLRKFLTETEFNQIKETIEKYGK